VEDNAWLGLLDPFGLLTADTPPAAPVTPVTLQASPAPSVDANRRRGFMTVYSNPKIGKKKYRQVGNLENMEELLHDIRSWKDFPTSFGGVYIVLWEFYLRS
jgi:hypothetical protein